MTTASADRKSHFGLRGAIASLAGGGILLALAFTRRGTPPPTVAADEPLQVTTALVTKQTVAVELQGAGSVEAANAVAVRSLVSGPIVKIHFRPGQKVKKGDPLFTLDDRPLKLALDRAEAACEKELAAAREADAVLARDREAFDAEDAESKRLERLAAQGLVPRARLDEHKKAAEKTRSVLKTDQAAVAGARARVRGAEAEREAARLQLSQALICAPIGGRTGSLSVSEGTVVVAEDATPLVTLIQPSPVKVAFTVPERDLARVNEASSAGATRVVAAPADDEAHAVTGAVTFVAPSVDKKTRSVRVEATFDNPERRLWPGQTARVTLALGPRPGTTVVPSRAVQSGMEGAFVYVVQGDHTVQPRPVKLGPTVEDLTVVEKGLQPGERVVTGGQRKLYPGARVETKNG